MAGQRFGIDAARLPAAKDMLAAGVTFAIGYVSRSAWKIWTPAKIADVRKAGIDPVFVFEDGATRPRLGKATGATDGRFAADQVANLGAPARQPIYFAVDYNVPASEMPAVLDYLRGAVDALGKARVGVYGGLPVIRAALDAGIVGYAWQTYAWSGGALDSRANLYQYSNGHTLGGASVDFCRSYTTDFGQWPTWTPPTPAPSKPAAPAPSKPAPSTPAPPSDWEASLMAKVQFIDSFEMAQLMAPPRRLSEAAARKEAEVVYPNETAALAGLGSYVSGIMRDVKDNETAIAALSAQVTALTAQVAALVKASQR